MKSVQMQKVELTYQVLNDCFQWDVTNWKRSLQLWKPIVCVDQVLDCLEIGSRNGGLSLYLALYGHQVLCTDLESPEGSAKPLHEKYGVSDLVKYEAIDALQIPYKNQFDIIIFKSVLGGIGRQNRSDYQLRAIREIFDVLKPGGFLLFAENLSGSAAHRFFRRTFMRWGKEWNYPDLQKLDDLLKIFPHRKIASTGFLGAFGRSRFQRKLLGAIDQGVVHYLTPASWHYIAFGFAQKDHRERI